MTPDADDRFDDDPDGWPPSRSGPPGPGDWLAAQAANAVPLAQAAMAVGQLDARLAAMTPDQREGATRRLALLEVEAMLWAQGTPLAREEIGLDLMQARAGTDLTAMAQARWAIRRLEGQAALDDLRAFLGLYRGGATEDIPLDTNRPRGGDFDEAAAVFLKARAGLAGLHPLAAGPAYASLWRLNDLSPDAAQVEFAVWQARAMAQACQALVFLPMGSEGQRHMVMGGDPARRLAVHLRDLAQAARDAARHLDQVRAWAERATRETAQIKGSNPARIVAALAAHPLSRTAMVEQASDISRDTAERLLVRMADMGLVREATGSRRFRLWAAAL